MLLKNYYYFYVAAVPHRFCDDVIEFSKTKETHRAKTQSEANEMKAKGKVSQKTIDKGMEKRDSEILWMDERWIYKELQPFVHQANQQAGWNFQWDFSEIPQFTKYALNQHYNWHTDSSDTPYNKPTVPEMHGKIRKLSLILSLSDPNDYEGGELQLDFRNNYDNDWKDGQASKVATELKERGSLIVFPSFLWHKLNSVTNGIRYSLVMWNDGLPFR